MDSIFNSDIWRQLFVLPGDQIFWWAEVVRSLIRLILGLLGTLGLVPVLVWLERRMLGWLQGRQGPNRVGPLGLMQPLADALKLMMKEDITPTNVDKMLYFMAPGVALASVIMSITVLPWNPSKDWGAVAPRLDIGILFLLAIASIEVYGVILAGWASNNKYSLLGGLRASSQVISYELGMGLSIIAVLLMAGTMNTQDIVLHQGLTRAVPVSGNAAYSIIGHNVASGFWDWHVFAFFPFGLVATVVYLISMIAETNRAPFDLPEAETELVAGFHTEYTSFKFAMFFMGEYANMVIVSAIAITLFFGGWLAPWGPLGQIRRHGEVFCPVGSSTWSTTLLCLFWFGVKLFTLLGFFILVRASLPRLRYDMLMGFGWKGLLPVALVNLLLIAVSLAFQSQFHSWWIGQVIAWAVGGVLAAILFGATYANYNKTRRAVKATGTVPVVIEPVGTTPAPSPYPIRRGSTAVSTPANVPVGEV